VSPCPAYGARARPQHGKGGPTTTGRLSDLDAPLRDVSSDVFGSRKIAPITTTTTTTTTTNQAGGGSDLSPHVYRQLNH